MSMPRCGQRIFRNPAGTKPHETEMVLSIGRQINLEGAEVIFQLVKHLRRRFKTGVACIDVLLRGNDEAIPRGPLH